jgi:hypothetical protein
MAVTLSVLALAMTSARAEIDWGEQTPREETAKPQDEASKKDLFGDKDDRPDSPEEESQDAESEATRQKGNADEDNANDDQPGEASEAEKDETLKLNTELNEHYREMARVTEMTDKQQEQLLKVQRVEVEQLDKYDKRYGDKIIRAETMIAREENERRRKRMEKQLEAVKAKREQILAVCDRQARRIMTPKQRAIWKGYRLWQQVGYEFDDVGITPDQEMQARMLMARLGTRLRDDVDIEKDKKLRNALLLKVYKEILTPEQQTLFRDKMTSR